MCRGRSMKHSAAGCKSARGCIKGVGLFWIVVDDVAIREMFCNARISTRAAADHKNKRSVQEWILKFQQPSVADPAPRGVDDHQSRSDLLGLWGLKGLQVNTTDFVEPVHPLQALGGVEDQSCAYQQGNQGSHSQWAVALPAFVGTPGFTDPYRPAGQPGDSGGAEDGGAVQSLVVVARTKQR